MMAVCGVVRRNGRILMCKRPAGGQYPGFWELPTESLEGDETFEDALERVFFERLTVVPQRMEFLGAVNFSVRGENEQGACVCEDVRLCGCEVELKKNFVHIYGYDDFRWVRPRDLKRLRVLRPCVTLVTGIL